MFESPNKRQYKRISFKEPIQLWEKDLMHTYGTLSCDVSEGGLRVMMNDFVPLDTEFVLSIPTQENHYIECPAKVVWVRQVPHSERFQAGLQFNDENIFTQTRKHLKELVGEV